MKYCHYPSLAWLASFFALSIGLFGQESSSPALPRVDAPPLSEAMTRNPSPEARLLPAADVWARPSDFLGESLSLEVQFHSELESWNPMLTRFGPGDYRGFRAWSEEQLLWIAEEYRSPTVRFFARKGSGAELAIGAAERFARFEVLCHVHSNFAGEPWVEIITAKPKLRRMSEGSVIHATRGMEFASKKLWSAAIAEFERADSDGLPEHIHQEFGRLVELCRKRVPIQLHERVESW